MVVDVVGAAVDVEVVVKQPFGRTAGKGVYAPAVGVYKAVIHVDGNAQPVLSVVNIRLSQVEAFSLEISHKRALQVGVADACSQSPASVEVELHAHAHRERQAEAYLGGFIVDPNASVEGRSTVAVKISMDAAALGALYIAESQDGKAAFLRTGGLFFFKGHLVQEGLVIILGLLLLGKGRYGGLLRGFFGGLGLLYSRGFFLRDGGGHFGYGRFDRRCLSHQMRFAPGKLFQRGHRFPGCLRHKYRRVRMCGFNDRGRGLQEHEQGHGRGGGQGAGIAPETQRNHAGGLVKRGLHALPNLGRDGLLCVL